MQHRLAYHFPWHGFRDCDDCGGYDSLRHGGDGRGRGHGRDHDGGGALLLGDSGRHQSEGSSSE